MQCIYAQSANGPCPPVPADDASAHRVVGIHRISMKAMDDSRLDQRRLPRSPRATIARMCRQGRRRNIRGRGADTRRFLGRGDSVFGSSTVAIISFTHGALYRFKKACVICSRLKSSIATVTRSDLVFRFSRPQHFLPSLSRGRPRNAQLLRIGFAFPALTYRAPARIRQPVSAALILCGRPSLPSPPPSYPSQSCHRRPPRRSH